MAYKRTNEHATRYVEMLKRQLDKKILKPEKKLQDKEALESEIERLKFSIEGILLVEQDENANMTDDEDSEIRKEMDELRDKLLEREQYIEELEDRNEKLTASHQLESNGELLEARKEMIKGICERQDACSFDAYASIGVKWMGGLDIETVFIATSKKYRNKMEAREKAQAICSCVLEDTQWDPFASTTFKNGTTKDIFDINFNKLKDIEAEHGIEVHNAVTKALVEMFDHDESGRMPELELYNFKEGRKATLKEGVNYILKQWKVPERSREELESLTL